MATFAQYAIASAHEALTDAGWTPTKEEDLEATVRGIMNFSKLFLADSPRECTSALALALWTMRTIPVLLSEMVYVETIRLLQASADARRDIERCHRSSFLDFSSTSPAGIYP